MSRQPVDHDVRERASSAVHTSIALTAGAGAGKTSVLVRRLARCLMAGTDPSRIAAITFTEKAAGEILYRVRIELESSGATLGSDAVTKVTVATLHSFARSLLATEPLEAAWAPGTDVLASASVAAEVDAWWREFRAREPGLATLVASGLSPYNRAKLSTNLLANRDLVPRTATPRSDEERFADLRDVVDRIESEAARCTSDADKLLRGNDAFRAELSRWLTLEPAEAVEQALSSDIKPYKRGGAAGAWPHGKDDFKEALDGVAAWRARVGADLHGVVVREMAEHVVPAVLASRTHGGTATFDDLLFRAAELLRDHDAVRHRLASRFDVVLIDEVQDTDPLQAEVALLLAREAAATGGWTDAPPRPGALFAVGDRQQSIYRFRRADVRTWGQLSATVAQGGESLSLTQNFRSVPGILDWVRQVFGDGAHPQVAWRGPAELDPVVVINSDDESELEHAVAWAWEVLQNGRVVDRDSGEPREVTASDLLFLVPKWTNADALAARLERAGIRADVEGGRTFFWRDELRLGIAALSCLVEPGDTASTALVLRGLFGLTLADLAMHKAAEGSLRVTLPDPPPGLVGDALRRLAAVRREAGGSLVDLLDRVLEASGAPAAWVLRADAASRFANIDKLRKLLRDEERVGGTRLEVLDRIHDLAYESDDEELSLTEPDQAAARVTTIFKAKGLEAPITFVVDFARGARVGDAISLRETGEVLVSASKALRPPGWDEAAEAEKTEIRSEFGRLAYVAATRARDQLVVLNVKRRDSLVELFGPGLPAPVEELERVTVGGATVLSVGGGSLDEAPDERAVFPGMDAAIDRRLEAELEGDDTEGREREEQLARRVRSGKRASTRWEAATARAAKSRGRGRPLEGSGLGPEADRLGTALHQMMEHLDLKAARAQQEADVDRLAPAMVRLAGVRDKDGVDKVTTACKRILAHPLLDTMRSAKRHLKEVPFVTGDGRTRVTGTIDLAFPLDDAETEWQVVDWKIHVPQSGPAREQYDAQLALYAKAVLAGVSPCERVTTALVGPHAELPPAEPEDDSLELVLDSMRPLLAALLKAGAPAPEVGVVIGDDLEAELVWEAQAVAVLDGPAEEIRGWTVFGGDVGVEAVLEALADTAGGCSAEA